MVDPGDGSEPEIEAFLRGIPVSEPDPVYRELVRAEFLGRASRAAGPTRMAQAMAEKGSAGHEPTDSDFQRWLREQSPSTVAPAAFREQSRRRFLSAGLAEGAPEGSPPEGLQGTLPSVHREPPRGWRRWVVPALAAAAIVVVTLVLPEPPRWKAEIRGPMRFAGADYDADAAGRFAVDLEQSGVLETLETSVGLVWAETLELEVRPGTRVEVSPMPPLDGVTPIDLRLVQGEVYVRTSPAYPGNPIRISTVDAMVEVLGTALGVLCDGGGTCVCVAEGSVQVSPSTLVAERNVAKGQALYLHRDASAGAEYLSFADIAGPHVDDLSAFNGSVLK